ncbi:hypothetical protein [Brevibacillus fulvus]|uniref:Uncharacterized protein n=1 Tax=Brevibacillus fulvus TaxID=1125967 RepID=A0A938XVJ7_9BACL|nr:hypothetical protein [Brevibacillus fulvus]MBM7590932.1 hypothetical protein [Brevibacillus fulvus]
MKLAMMITFTFLVLLLLSFLSFTLLTMIRKVEFEEMIVPPKKEDPKPEE